MKAPAHEPRVLVVMLNFNGAAHLAYSLPSLLAQPDRSLMDLLVVDNASADDSIAVARSHPGVEVLSSARNTGWAGGNNLGIRAALQRGFDYVALVNNDILVSPDWLRYPLSLCEADPSLAVVGYEVFGENEPAPRELFQNAVIARGALRTEPAGHVGGMAMFCRTAAFRSVGLMDESLFMYGEEDDFEARVLLAGWKMAKCNVPIWHHAEGTAARVIPLRSSYYAMRNGMRYHLKYEGVTAFARAAAYYAREAVRRTSGDTARGVTRRLRPGRWPTNLSLVLGALTANLLRLPLTLMERGRLEAQRRTPPGLHGSGVL